MGNKKIELVFHENKNNAGSINILTKRVGRGEKDTTEATLLEYENTMAPSTCTESRQTTPLVESGNEVHKDERLSSFRT